MPIYEYKCENGHVFDIMQKMSEDPLRSCIECEAPVKKLLHPVNISFRGSGFYSTDYKGGKKPDKADTVKSGSPDTNNSETKSESNGAKKSAGSSAEKKVAKSED
ncbi:MAG: FmdB family zinc ribbon protein [Rubrobacteraceae bacterium]